MGDEGKPGKKMKLKGKMRKLDRPPENPVVDVSELCFGPTHSTFLTQLHYSLAHRQLKPIFSSSSCSPLLNLTVSQSIWMLRAGRCTRTSLRGSTGSASPGLREPTPSWQTRWVQGRPCRLLFSSIHCIKRCALLLVLRIQKEIIGL